MSVIKNKCKSFDTSKGIDEYITAITNYVFNLEKHIVKKDYNNCSKADIMKYYLNEHSMIDSVTITPSGHGISFYRKNDKVWANILME